MRCSKILWKSTQFGNSRVSFGKHEIGINTRSLTEMIFQTTDRQPTFKAIRQTIVGIVVAGELGRAKANSILPAHRDCPTHHGGKYRRSAGGECLRIARRSWRKLLRFVVAKFDPHEFRRVRATICGRDSSYQARDQRGPVLALASRNEPLTPASSSSLRPNSHSKSESRLR
jgi:hypothetical protein